MVSIHHSLEVIIKFKLNLNKETIVYNQLYVALPKKPEWK